MIIFYIKILLRPIILMAIMEVIVIITVVAVTIILIQFSTHGSIECLYTTCRPRSGGELLELESE